MGHRGHATLLATRAQRRDRVPLSILSLLSGARFTLIRVLSRLVRYGCTSFYSRCYPTRGGLPRAPRAPPLNRVGS